MLIVVVGEVICQGRREDGKEVIAIIDPMLLADSNLELDMVVPESEEERNKGVVKYKISQY